MCYSSWCHKELGTTGACTQGRLKCAYASKKLFIEPLVKWYVFTRVIKPGEDISKYATHTLLWRGRNTEYESYDQMGIVHLLEHLGRGFCYHSEYPGFSQAAATQNLELTNHLSIFFGSDVGDGFHLMMLETTLTSSLPTCKWYPGNLQPFLTYTVIIHSLSLPSHSILLSPPNLLLKKSSCNESKSN